VGWHTHFQWTACHLPNRLRIKPNSSGFTSPVCPELNS
jgi:hypothetical protein